MLREFLRDLQKSLIQRISRERFIYRVRGTPSTLFLTFDDGPHPQHTRAVLDVLDQHRAKATFFLVGQNVERHPELVKLILERGHSVGLHTQTHMTMDKMTHARFEQEITDNQNAIQQAAATRPIILRPPQGRLTLPSLYWALSRGLRVIHYTITSNDWKAERAEDIVGIFDRAAVRDGDILSFHDNNTHTVKAVSTLLERYTRAGFRFGAIA